MGHINDDSRCLFLLRWVPVTGRAVGGCGGSRSSLEWLAGVAGKDVIRLRVDHLPPFTCKGTADPVVARWSTS